LFTSSLAHAATKQECVDASDRGQAARTRGALLAAKDAFIACADSACPPIVRTACAGWLDEVERATPSIVVQATGSDHACDGGSAARRDLVDVRVSLDGAPWLAHLEGRALAVDPGRHVLRLEAGGYTTTDKALVVPEGAKSLSVPVSLESSRDPCPAAPAQAKVTPPDRRSIPVATIALGATSVVSFGAFAYFGIAGHSEYQSLETACKPHCTSAQTASVTRSFVTADVALGVAIVTLGLATYFQLTSRGAPRARARSPEAIAQF
jgi:hypothetical protein